MLTFLNQESSKDMPLSNRRSSSVGTTVSWAAECSDQTDTSEYIDACR